MLSSLRRFNTKRQWPFEPHARLRLRRREHRAGHQVFGQPGGTEGMTHAPGGDTRAESGSTIAAPAKP
ncbi:hypothetical protein ES332_D10G087700v1 [Gossypium tomentosum]|uniref:Uncharacterized protein n=1 Tax=Gossypium tomentosum TaxID=34277 RepID=A0A5D2J3B0_GOSTO|nr:hypothetical protein ES332_D10G087700v1 [Gossypium tomentosum]